MCNRYFLTSSPDAVRRTFGYAETPEFPPRYNIAPTQPVAIVHYGLSRQPEFRLVRWGLVPAWWKNPRELPNFFNARAEGLLDKPSFRGPFRHRRCLVPADGFYEWTGEKGRRVPHAVRPRSGGPIAFAGLHEIWLGADGSELETMAIITVAAAGTLARLHDRMPAILPPSDFAAWFDPRTKAEAAHAMLRPVTDDELMVTEVARRVNDARNDGPDLLAPVAGQADGTGDGSG